MREHLVTDQQNGATVPMRVGDSVLLSLAENPASGYRWSIEELDESLVASESTAYASEDQRPGSGGRASWTLRARAAGRTTVRLVHWRHWEGKGSAIARFSLTLEIERA
jgi:inhibitor of cysteine peptidase